MRKFLLDMRKDFLVMSNFYLVEILGEPNNLTKIKIRNLQCKYPTLVPPLSRLIAFAK